MSFFAVDEPLARAVPLIVAVPHAGTRLPEGMDARLRVPPAAVRRLEDPWVDALFATASAVGGWRLTTAWARAVVDVNRAPDEFAGLPPETGFRATPKARVGLGVVPSVLAGAPLYVPALTADEIGARLALAYRPYHDALARLLADVRNRFGGVLLLDAHSMPDGAWAPQPPLADVVLGDGFGRSATPATFAAVEAAFRRHGFRTLRNRPYAGGHVTQHYGRPAAGTEVLQIEIRRSLYMDEARFEPLTGLGAVREALGSVLEDVAAWLEADRPVPFALAGE